MLYLFDVDGTLTDSAPDITGAVSEVLRRNDLPPQTFEHLRTYIGKHLRELFFDIVPDCNEAQSDALIAEYRTIYAAREHSQTRVYEGIAEALAGLGGVKATATTKGTPTTRIVLEKFGLIQYFDHVQGTDGFPAKPAPDVIYKSLDRFQVAASEVLFIGDSEADMAAGRAAGVKLCAVRWGYGDIEKMARYQPDYWVDAPEQLLAFK